VTERTELERQATRLEQLLKRGDTYELQELVEKVHPSDLADILEELDEEHRLRLIGLLPASTAGETLAEMEEVEHPEELLARLEPQKLAEVVEEMPDDDAADLIGELDPEEQARVLASLEDPSTIEELLHYPEDSAGGIMTRELVAVPSFLTAGEALSEIRRQAREIPGFYTIFVVDRHGKLCGVMNLQSLVMADPDQPVSDLIEAPPAVVPVLGRYNLAAIGVVDTLDRLVGRITFDDVIDVMEAETTEDILRFASVSEEEELRGSTMAAVKSRLPWLVLSLITAAAASSVVYLYRNTVEQIVILAAVMPVIAALGGNAGTQALAVTIRRIALSDESLIERWSVVGKELAVGLMNGLMILSSCSPCGAT
jgi:magnesium transporter